MDKGGNFKPYIINLHLEVAEYIIKYKLVIANAMTRILFYVNKRKNYFIKRKM